MVVSLQAGCIGLLLMLGARRTAADLQASCCMQPSKVHLISCRRLVIHSVCRRAVHQATAACRAAQRGLPP